MDNQIPLRIVLVEDDPVECDRMRNYIEDIDNVTLLGVADNSTDGLKLVQDFLPNIVILDLELRAGSGLVFLRELRRLSNIPKPYILVCSNSSSDLTIAAARSLGMDYFFKKYQEDYSPEAVVDFLSLIANHSINFKTDCGTSVLPPEERKIRLRNRIRTELGLVRISSKAKGYDLLTDAIQMAIETGDTSKITERIAVERGLSESRTERSMHDAIKAAWSKASPEDLLDNYPSPVSSRTGAPTILEFINTYARKIGDEYV